ncbi:MAG: L,D-transpeptidase family protein [Solirubrobacteraceae bacterium]
MALVSYLRPAVGQQRSAQRAHRRLTAIDSPRRGHWIAGCALVLVLVVIAAGAVLVLSSRATLSADGVALARVGMPFGGATIQSVSVVSGAHAAPIPSSLRGHLIWPKRLLAAHHFVSIEVTIKRPGWISWIAGSTEHLRLTLMTPSTSLSSRFLTLRAGAPLKLTFRSPVAVVSYGQPGRLVRHVLQRPSRQIAVPRVAQAGTISVAGAPRSWETSAPTLVSWFPSGSAASAVATPAPGSTILPQSRIMLTFSRPIAQALGSQRPPVSPSTPGTWHTLNSHQMVFEPEGYGYGLGAKVTIGLPSGVKLIGGQSTSSYNGGTWTVPGGSTLRLQQMLSTLRYLPLSFHYAGAEVPRNVVAEESAAVNPPAGSFSWTYPSTPDALKSSWAPGSFGVMTRGALMAFENDHGLTADGIAGPQVWRSLIAAAVSGARSSFGYTFVTVSLGGQHLSLWHNGQTVVEAAVNTGIAQAPTATGTYPVYEHLRVTTMSGTNPDGSHYNDPGIQFVSYFNGGDALHAFTRAQYGFPQSLGCVEMALGPAGQVWPYTPIGTLVHVA